MNTIPNKLRLKAILFIPLILSRFLNFILRPQHVFPGKTVRPSVSSHPNGIDVNRHESRFHRISASSMPRRISTIAPMSGLNRVVRCVSDSPMHPCARIGAVRRRSEEAE